MKVPEKIVYFVLLLSAVALMAVTNQYKTPYDLPKIIWTHWDTPDINDKLKRILQKRREVLSDWDVRFVTTKDVLADVPPQDLPKNFHKQKKQHQSDWMRMYLLEKYGGVWMDIGIIVNESITPLYKECAKQKADLCVFFIDAKTVDPYYPIVENWFIMAPRGSPLIKLWKAEYEKALDMGFLPYKKELMANNVIGLKNLFKKDDDVYLTQHACIQNILQNKFPKDAKIIYKRAEDTMFKVQTDCKWKRPCMKDVFNDKTITSKIPYLKLRGGDRDLMSIDSI